MTPRRRQWIRWPDRREQTIDRLQKRNRISGGEIDNLRTLLVPADGVAALAQANLVTEAVSEKTQVKLAVYKVSPRRRLRRPADDQHIVGHPRDSIERWDRRQRKFSLTHFFNPVLYTQMVEVVSGDMTAQNRESILSFLTTLGRDPVPVQDISGFVSNGILMIYAVMAVRLLERGARIDQVDQAAKELKLLPPFVSFDSWKPAIVEDVTRIMAELRGDTFLRSSPLLSRLAKDNPRFYVDQKPNPKIYQLADAQGKSLDDENVKRALMTSMLVAAARVAELGETPATVDLVATEGIKMPQPPLKQIDATGAAALREELEKTNRMLGRNPLAIPAILAEKSGGNKTFYPRF